VNFEVYGDGKLLVNSGAIAFNQPARHITADVSGVGTVELVARQQGVDTGPVVVAWGDAAFRWTGPPDDEARA
jgi:alpha-galactosidase